MLVATAGAATQGPPSFATVGVHAGAHAAGESVAVDAGVAAPDAHAPPAPDAPAIVIPAPPAPHPSPPPASGGNASSNSTGNQTPPPPPPQNATADHAPVLSPHHLSVVGSNGHAEFNLSVGNAAHQAQTVWIDVRAPSQWHVTLSHTSFALHPRESAIIHGAIDLNVPPVIGSSGSLIVIAHDDGGNDSATVDGCFDGVAVSCGGSPPPPTNGTGNQTSPPPTNSSGNQTQPPTNSSGNSTGGNSTGGHPIPIDDGVHPGSNGTAPPPSNSTGNSTHQPPSNHTSDNSTYQPPSNGTYPLPPQGNSSSAPTAPALPTDEPTTPSGGDDDAAGAYATVNAQTNDGSETVGV